MPNRLTSHWTAVIAVGLPLFVAGCAGTPTYMADQPPPPSAARTGHGSTSIMELADKLSAEKSYSNAAAMYSQAHQNSPNDVAPLLGLGRSLLAMGANADAASAYGKALELQPSNTEALRGLGHARILLGQPEFAMVQYQAALKQDARDLRALNGLGVAQDMNGDHQAAQATYKAALAIDPANQSARNNLALSLALTGDDADAIKMLEEVNRSTSATAVNRQNLALVYGVSGHLDEAKRVSSADLPEQQVDRNLAALSAGGKNRSERLKDALGVELKGVQYVPPARPVVPLNNLALSPADEKPIYLSGSSGEQMATISVDAQAKPHKKKPDGAAASGDDEAWADDWNEELVDATDVNGTKLAPATAGATPSATEPLPPSPDLQPVTLTTTTPTPAAPATAAPEVPAVIGTTAIGAEASAAKDEMPAARTATAEAHAMTAVPAPAVAAGTPGPAAVVTPPATPAGPTVAVATTSGSAKVYTLQLASYRNESEAAKGWQALTTDQGDLLSGLPHTVEKADLGTGKGIFFRLKAGSFSDIKAAKSLCKDLQVRSVDCMVVEATPSAASPTGSVQQSMALHDKPIMVGSR